MTDFLLEQTDAPGVFFADILTPTDPAQKKEIRVTDYVPLAEQWSSRPAAQAMADALPGRWTVRPVADIPPRILK